MTTIRRVLGIDYGEKRIGLAVSDPLGLTAQGLETLVRSGEEKDVRALQQTIEKWEVVTIVIGLPRHMDGTAGEQAGKVERFAERLRQATGRTVTTWDERLTTVAAERILIEGGVRRQQRKSLRDRLAAVLILQGYLDRQQQRWEEEGQ